MKKSHSFTAGHDAVQTSVHLQQSLKCNIFQHEFKFGEGWPNIHPCNSEDTRRKIARSKSSTHCHGAANHMIC